MNSLINFFKNLFTKDNDIVLEGTSIMEHEQLKETDLISETIPLEEPIEEKVQNLHKDIEQSHNNVLYAGKWNAKDMNFAQLWNNDQYKPKERNYTRYMLIYRTPEYRSIGDENGGSDNGRTESINLTVNIEEGKVFLEDYMKASKIFKDKSEVEVFIQEAQKKFDTELDMGKGTNFIYGYGGCMANLMEYDNHNIQYIPITFPDTEKFRIPNYRKTVMWDLIKKGAIFINPKEGESYLAVIQRKNKPRNLRLFSRYLNIVQ